MDVRYDPKFKPLRGSPSAYMIGRASCNIGVTRFSSCLGLLLVMFVIGTMFYIDWGVTGSLSQPMIRKSADYLTHLADDMENYENQSTVNTHEPNAESYTTDPATNITQKITQEDHSEKDDANPVANGEWNHQVENSNFDVAENGNQLSTTTEKKKPRLFLHVGPQKTGSSTFQSILDKLSKLTGELQGDNINIRHIMPQTGDFDCDIGEWGCFHNCKASEELKTLIQKTRDEGKDLLLTDENLDGNYVSALRDTIDDNDWDVTVIVMYRRIHEWLISWYNQINKTTNKDSNGKILFNEKGIPYRTEHTYWPDQGGDHIPSFSSWYEKYTRQWEPAELANKHRSVEFYNLYNEAFDNVLLYNLHQEGDMVTNIICNVIGAANACEKITSHKIEVTKTNGSVDLDNDILSVYANDKGHIAKTLQRKEVVDAVTKYIQDSGKVLPRKCNQEMANEIRTWLVDTEKIMVGDQNWSNTEEEELLNLYESFVSNSKLCDLDKEAILQDEDWLRFFHSLGNQIRQNMVLHVGPIGGKTIHDTLKTLSGEGGKLQQDGYELADIQKENHFDCTGEDCKASERLKSMFSSFEDAQTNVIIADDSLDEKFIKPLKEAIDERKWNLKVVVGYVRLDQLLLMVYNNEYDYDHQDLDGLHLLGETESPDKGEHFKWPDEGGTTIPGFNKWFDAFAQDSIVKKIEQLSMHLRDLYISSFDDVDFFAYHQRDDLVRNFVCKLVPEATQSCATLKNADAKSSNTKWIVSNYTEADILAVHAHESGLVKKEVSRETVRNAIMEKLRSMEKVLSRVCISEVTKQLYDWIVENEKSIIGANFTSKRIAWINEDFQYFMESGKLCALDVEKELQEKRWLDFFKYNPKLVPDPHTTV